MSRAGGLYVGNLRAVQGRGKMSDVSVHISVTDAGLARDVDSTRKTTYEHVMSSIPKCTKLSHQSGLSKFALSNCVPCAIFPRSTNGTEASKAEN
jgi:hypothetical protein